jgi:hypothetical protein
MNVNTFETMSYEQRTMNYEIKNEPKRTQFKANIAPKMPKRTQNEPNLSRRSLWPSRNKPNFKEALTR